MRDAEPKAEREIVNVAYKGVLAPFRLYALPDGRRYVKLPDGRRAYVTPRRDGSYIITE